MAATASWSSVPLDDLRHQQISDELDEEIKIIRAQIQVLTQRRKTISAHLLASTKIQSQLRRLTGTEEGLPSDIDPLLAESYAHAESNLHRLAFGVTAFPFTDPNPEISKRRLLGVRIDVCRHDGKYGKPFYLLCQTINDNSNDVKIHRHTLPAFIPLKDYEEEYLPLPDEGYGSDDGSAMPVKQDLHGLVARVRRDLVSWTLRRDAVDLLKDELGLAHQPDEDGETEAADDYGEFEGGKYGIWSVSALESDARYVRIEWIDGVVGRVKISDEGRVERAVVFGEEGRLKPTEKTLSEGDVSIRHLAEKLKIVYEQGEANQAPL